MTPFLDTPSVEVESRVSKPKYHFFDSKLTIYEGVSGKNGQKKGSKMTKKGSFLDP